MEVQNQKIEIRSIEDGNWYWISRKVLEGFASKIGAIGLALYSAYASYAGNKGVAFPSQRTLAGRLGISVKTIIKYNKKLQENGLIKIEKRKGRSNLITLLKVEDMNQVQTPPVAGSEGVLNQVQTKENNIKENKLKENTKVDAKASPLDVIDYFKRRVKELKGFYPEIDYGKDGKLAKERLKKYSFNEVKDLIDWYLNSEHFERFGASLSICLSNFIINLWKASKMGQRSISNLYPLWQRRS
jgi:DNA-binding Lrp family transcriptional regulator